MARVEVGPDDDTVEASVGDSVVITLTENGTTGYQWTVDSDSDHAVVESNEYAPPGRAAPGAAGQRVVKLAAQRPGSARVRLHLKRPWEEDAAEHRDLTIVIRDNNS
jgi:inhibitor of cysteine peptidase